ncbi:hypothetical protein Tco_1321665 [Tanacetum coccineum]
MVPDGSYPGDAMRPADTCPSNSSLHSNSYAEVLLLSRSVAEATGSDDFRYYYIVERLTVDCWFPRQKMCLRKAASLPPRTGGKSLTALRGMVPDGSIIPSDATRPIVTASVTPTPDIKTMDYVSGLNLWTCPPHVRYVVSSDSSLHSDLYFEAASLVRSAADALVVTIAVTTTIDANVAATSKEIELTSLSSQVDNLLLTYLVSNFPVMSLIPRLPLWNLRGIV